MPHPVDVHVGKRLRLRRTILGMSQESLGDSIGVTFQQVQKYERGINRMGASRLYDFSRVLQVPVSFFFEGFSDQGKIQERYSLKGLGESSPEENAESPQLASRETLEMVRAYYKIRPAVRKRFADLAKALAEMEEGGDETSSSKRRKETKLTKEAKETV